MRRLYSVWLNCIENEGPKARLSVLVPCIVPIMTVAYLSYLPCAFMRSIAGFPKEGKGYFLPHTQEVPGEALCSNVWPEADKLVERMESHPDKADNDMQLDLGSGFPRLLRDSGPRA